MTPSPRCLACRRVLSDPESIKRGLGPVCAAKLPSRSDSDRLPFPGMDDTPAGIWVEGLREMWTLKELEATP